MLSQKDIETIVTLAAQVVSDLLGKWERASWDKKAQKLTAQLRSKFKGRTLEYDKSTPEYYDEFERVNARTVGIVLDAMCLTKTVVCFDVLLESGSVAVWRLTYDEAHDLLSGNFTSNKIGQTLRVV